MFSPMSSGADDWPTTRGPLSASSKRSSAASTPAATFAAQLGRARSPVPRAGPPDRVLSPIVPPSREAPGPGGLGNFLGWKGKGKAKQGGPGRLAGPSSSAAGASLEATGWNQPLYTEADALLPPAVRGAVAGGGILGKGKGKGKGPVSASMAHLAASPYDFPSAPIRRGGPRHATFDDSLAPPLSTASRLSSRSLAGPAKQRRWYMDLFRPTRERVEEVLNTWGSRHGVLCILPCLIVWFWCAVPFPKSHPDSPGKPWCDDTPDAPWCRDPQMPSPGGTPQDTDPNFWFFLLFYYGLYAAVALVYITQLFSLYRLNWWPSALGAKTSYTFFWLLSISAGYLLHHFRFDSLTAAPGKPNEDGSQQDTLSVASSAWAVDAPARAYRLCAGILSTLTSVVGESTGTDGGGDGGDDYEDIQWQRKTLWVGLAFATMSMPALVCLVGLRRSGRQMYRHSLTDMQKTFLERQLARRIPASYVRYLWFISTIGLNLVALIAGQGYASVYLSTLPHTGLDGTAYVTFWMTTVNLLAIICHWILEEKVRSRALLFANKYYYFLVYFIFYRNLFARLRSFDQFALVQLMSSFWVCIWYPLSMTSLFHRITQHFNPRPKSWEEYVESVGLAFYLRNLAQNTTMVAFLGWVSLLHFGKNQHLYPFFSFDDQRDPYNYQLTMLGSGAIWASELITSFLARAICKWTFGVDVTNLGLDEFREFPELLPTCVWSSVHVLMDMLLFLIKLNFR